MSAGKYCLPAVWLRTHYPSSPSADPLHDSLVASVEIYNAVGGPHRLLNDPHLYNFGQDWQRIFEVLPELLEPPDGNWISHLERQREAEAELRAYVEGGVARAPEGLVRNLSPYDGMPGFEGDQLSYYVEQALQSAVHKTRVVNWIVVENEEVLRGEGEVLVAFVDCRGRVVRQKRDAVAAAEQLGGFWASCSWGEIQEWEDGEWGVEYQAGGEEGG